MYSSSTSFPFSVTISDEGGDIPKQEPVIEEPVSYSDSEFDKPSDQDSFADEVGLLFGAFR